MKTDKIIQPANLSAWLERRDGMGPISVVAGTYDILQPGNLHVLRQARAAGATVLVVLESDAVAQTHVSAGRPQYALGLRLETVAGLRWMDGVTWGDSEFPAACLRGKGLVRWFTGASQRGDHVWRGALEASVGETVEVEPLAGCFTEDILGAIRANATPIKVPDGLFGNEQAAVAGKGRRVTVNGCFDILHVGHYRFLERARAMGDSLTVLINDDASVARYKGPTRPVFPLAFRRAALMSLDVVDDAAPFAGDTPLAMLAELKPDIHVKGGSFEPDRVRQERELLESWGGRLVGTPMEEGFSTSGYIRKAMGG